MKKIVIAVVVTVVVIAACFVIKNEYTKYQQEKAVAEVIHQVDKYAHPSKDEPGKGEDGTAEVIRQMERYTATPKK